MSATIPLLNNGAVVAHAIVDEADHAALSLHVWHLHRGSKTDYAVRHKRVDSVSVAIFMHREILGLAPRASSVVQPDHLNHNGLDNRRANLRAVTPSENARTRRQAPSQSGVVGVYPAGKRWRAELWHHRQRVHMSYHDTKAEAVSARTAAVDKHVTHSQATP